MPQSKCYRSDRSRFSLASLSSPDVKITVFGLCDEKYCIQAMGVFLIDFTSLAPTANSATISLEVHPFKAAIDLFAPSN